MTASTFLFFNNFSSYKENPASDLLLEYDRLQGEIADKKFSENGLKYLNRLKLEISNRIAYRLKIQDCNEFFNEHPHADNGKYILYPEGSTNSKAVFLCEKNMNVVAEKKLLDLNSRVRPVMRPKPTNRIDAAAAAKSFEAFDQSKKKERRGFSRQPTRNQSR